LNVLWHQRPVAGLGTLRGIDEYRKLAAELRPQFRYALDDYFPSAAVTVAFSSRSSSRA